MKATATKMVRARSHWQNAEELRWAVRSWAARIGVKAPQVHMREMRRKWASISTEGRLTLNTELVDLPRELGEFVIVHELVHRLAPKHGQVFKSFMHAYFPACTSRPTRLKEAARRTA